MSLTVSSGGEEKWKDIDLGREELSKTGREAKSSRKRKSLQGRL